MKLYNVNIDEGYVIPAKNHGSPRSSVRASSKSIFPLLDADFIFLIDLSLSIFEETSEGVRYFLEEILFKPKPCKKFKDNKFIVSSYNNNNNNNTYIYKETIAPRAGYRKCGPLYS